MKKRLIVICLLLITLMISTISAYATETNVIKEEDTTVFNVNTLKQEVTNKIGDKVVELQEKSKLMADDMGAISSNR